MEGRLNVLQQNIEAYKTAVSRVFTIRANNARLAMEEDRAFRKGELLVNEVNQMITIASSKLSARTEAALVELTQTKIVLFGLVFSLPFLAAGLGIFFIRGLQKPLDTLVKATGHLKKGELDYRIEGLEAEFGTVADSFNAMSHALKENLSRVRESENRFRTIYDNVIDGILLYRPDTLKIIDGNNRILHLLDISREELEASSIQDICTEEVYRAADDGAERPASFDDIVLSRRDGTVFNADITASSIVIEDREYRMLIVRDISERKQAERLIQQSRLDWEDTFNTITDMITIHDMDFNIIRANRAAQKILGLPFLGVNRAKCYEHYHGMDRPPESCPSCESLKTGKPILFEMFEPHLNRFLEVRALPRINDRKEVKGIIHIVRDITERKQVEEAMRRAEQMRQVGEWAAGLAHEIKNPLAGIKISVEVLSQESDLSEENRSIIARVVDEIRRIEMLLKNLIDYAKPSKPQLEVTDINDILDRTVDFSLDQHSHSSNNRGEIKLQKDLDAAVPNILIDPYHVRQSLLNLLLNAADSMLEGGTLTVRTYYNKRQESIDITIADTGVGISPAVAEKIFEPFFTTKSKGSGLGLAITKRLMEQYGGTISVHSEEGKGTEFTISLPVRKNETPKVVT
jgi:PAS domain S-box-containing protein